MRLYIIIYLFLCLTAFPSYSQIITLEVRNPFPRVGDECEIDYTINSDTFKISKTISFKEQMKAIKDKELGNGTMKFTSIIRNSGYAVFGPFTFIVDEKKIQSDIITLYFDIPLPNQKSGIWIRQNSYLGQEYLIIEQRISGKWITTKQTDNSTSSEFQKDDDEFIEIDEEKINDKYIKFDFINSNIKSQNIEINGKSETFSYKISVYKINKTELLKDKFKLNKNNFKYLLVKQNNFEFYVK